MGLFDFPDLGKGQTVERAVWPCKKINPEGEERYNERTDAVLYTVDAMSDVKLQICDIL